MMTADLVDEIAVEEDGDLAIIVVGKRCSVCYSNVVSGHPLPILLRQGVSRRPDSRTRCESLC
jgi:hypothetical protein